MLTKKSTKKQFLEHVSHNDVFEGTWKTFGDFGHFLDKKNVHFGQNRLRFPQILPLTLTFFFLFPFYFLTHILGSFFSFTKINRKISVRNCWGWSHDLFLKNIIKSI